MLHREPQHRLLNPNSSARQTSSSSNQQAHARRDAGRLAENKLMTCPNCEKNVREQDLSGHLQKDCLDKEFITCDSCGWSFPQDSYGRHIEQCQQNRNGRQRQSSEDSRQTQLRETPERNRSQERRNRDLRTHNRRSSPQAAPMVASRPYDSEQESVGCLEFLAHGCLACLSMLFGVHHTHHHHTDETREESRQQDRQEPRRQQLSGPQQLRQQPRPELRPEPRPEPRQESRRDQRRQEPIQWQRVDDNGEPSTFQARRQEPNPGRSHVLGPNSSVTQPQNALVPYVGPTTRRIRTVEVAPGGVLLIRSHEIPVNPFQMVQGPPNYPLSIGHLGPMSMLLNVLSAGFPGTRAIGNGELEPVPAQSQGLNPEVLSNMAIVKYDPARDKNVDPEAKTCPICLDEYEEGQELRFLWCMHRFHRDCVDSWLKKHTNCPICKKDFSEAESGFSP